ncbi:MAG TPA: hypothetical protein VL752_19675 [Acidisoma sp.]|uniref:hypothetical protein n=1 Tax=Acidisoma sp. TaxID=1872115 RepID=UPI002CA48672|nr:hypothetical protein [Acidisoma sp.]HTI03173.1 hypothetical protein [Acidisoma sp.]
MMRSAAAFLALGLMALPSLGQAATVCASGMTDDTLRPLPPRDAEAARHAFGLGPDMPGALIAQLTVYRCDAGRMLMCTAGANLPCGKADTARQLTAATHWCADNPDADAIPAYVTGHDTAYQWSCQGGKAVPGQIAPLDDRGFFESYWKPAP